MIQAAAGAGPGGDHQPRSSVIRTVTVQENQRVRRPHLLVPLDSQEAPHQLPKAVATLAAPGWS